MRQFIIFQTLVIVVLGCGSDGGKPSDQTLPQEEGLFILSPADGDTLWQPYLGYQGHDCESEDCWQYIRQDSFYVNVYANLPWTVHAARLKIRLRHDSGWWTGPWEFPTSEQFSMNVRAAYMSYQYPLTIVSQFDGIYIEAEVANGDTFRSPAISLTVIETDTFSIANIPPPCSLADRMAWQDRPPACPVVVFGISESVLYVDTVNISDNDCHSVHNLRYGSSWPHGEYRVWGRTVCSWGQSESTDTITVEL